jgi:quercetin dioxygenase-like cupin family protein
LARDWVVFADTKTAPVEPFFGTDLQSRVLSTDADRTHFSMVVDVPAGWQGEVPTRSDSSYEEIYVLSGDVEVGDTQLRQGDYRFCPPGLATAGLRGSTGGARIFVKRGESGSDRPLIERLRAEDMVWTERGEGANASDFSILSEGTSGTVSRIFRVPAGWYGRHDGGHFHSSSEEVFVVSGDIRNDKRNRYEEGCFLYRPGGIMHGYEERSDNGCSLLGFFEEGEVDFTYATAMDDPKSVIWE